MIENLNLLNIKCIDMLPLWIELILFITLKFASLDIAIQTKRSSFRNVCTIVIERNRLLAMVPCKDIKALDQKEKVTFMSVPCQH